MKGVVLTGGTGQRMSPLTNVTNKHLLPLYDEPMIYKVIQPLIHANIKDIMIVLGGNSIGDIVRLVGSGKIFGDDVHVSYVYQDRPGGIAEALSLSEHFVGDDDLALLLGDNYFHEPIDMFVKEFINDTQIDCYLFLKEVPNPYRFGIAELDNNGNILSIEEKPKHPKSNWAITGLYFYRSNVFNRIGEIVTNVGYSERGELEITDVNNLYVQKGSVKGIKYSGFWSDAGLFHTLLRTANFIASEKGVDKLDY